MFDCIFEDLLKGFSFEWIHLESLLFTRVYLPFIVCTHNERYHDRPLNKFKIRYQFYFTKSQNWIATSLFGVRISRKGGAKFLSVLSTG